MIVATAGHVDHGKTTLIKALTGVETDQLAEEKRRGMTIDIGFAYLPIQTSHDAQAEPIGFIDVPGHQDFIRNTLSGFAGADFALLVVAADDGPRPQTIEHLGILDLLEIRLGAVVLTKIDRVPDQRLVAVHDQIKTLLAGTALADVPIFKVASSSGVGIEPLKNHLIKVAADFSPRACSGNFRLAIDRCFNLKGAGLIVTGTALSGSLAVGDQLRLLGCGAPARARSIHAQNRNAGHARAGQRCAINLAGTALKSDSIQRGEWAVTGDVPEPRQKIDARMRILNTEPRPFAHWTPVHVHLGAAHTTGRIALLGGAAIEPGASALVQLTLDQAIGAAYGDRFIVRDQSAQRTIGGGRVIDIFPPARGRSKPGRLAELVAHEMPDPALALAGLLAGAEGGVLLENFRINRNLTVDECATLFAQVPMARIITRAGPVGFSTQLWSEMRSSILAGLAAWHERLPAVVGPPVDRILEGTGHRMPRETVIAIAAELGREGVIVKNGMGVRLPSHTPHLDLADEALWQRIEPLLRAGGLRPPSVSDLSYVIGGGVEKIEATLGRVARCGRVIRVSPKHYFVPEFVLVLAEIMETLVAQRPDGNVTVASFRDNAGIGRNLSVEVLEFFDKVKFTRRVGAGHLVNCAASHVFSG